MSELWEKERAPVGRTVGGVESSGKRSDMGSGKVGMGLGGREGEVKGVGSDEEVCGAEWF